MHNLVFAFETCFTVCYADSYILYLEPLLAVGHVELQCTKSFPKDDAVGNNIWIEKATLWPCPLNIGDLYVSI